MKTSVVNIYKEPFDVKIMRPGPFGNPFQIGRDGAREEVIEKYRAWLKTQPELLARMERELKGKRLGCCCKPKACHGDVIVEVLHGK